MKQTYRALLIVLPMVFPAGCHRTQEAKKMDPQQALIGTWVTPGGLTSPRSTEWGPMLFEFTFMPDGMMTVKLTSISSTGERDSHVDSGAYQVIGQQFVSELVYDEEPIRFEIRGDRLFLHAPDEQMELVRE